jgi:hypothetical protein
LNAANTTCSRPQIEMVIRRFRRSIAAATVLSVAAVISGLWSALYEGFGVRVLLRNCLPPTLGFGAVVLSSGQSPRRRTAAAAFASMTALTSIFFFAAWFFTLLDLDPHSATKMLVFIFAPLISAGLAILGYVIAGLQEAGAELNLPRDDHDLAERLREGKPDSPCAKQA